MHTQIGFDLLGALLFLFLFWKRLREDYSSEMVFTVAIYILVFLGVAVALASSFLPLWWFWFGFLGISVGMALGIFKFHLKVYETIEASVLATLPWLSLVFLSDSARTSSLSSFIAFILCLVLIFLFYFLDTHYKNFTWYRSGKIGFTGLTVLGFFFLLRAVLAIPFSTVLSFAGKGETLVSLPISLISFLFIIKLAR